MLDQSLWRAHDVPRFGGALPNRVDVVVIGGGITGLTAALLLKRAGKTVAVFEREHIGSGESGNTSAHLTYVNDVMLSEMATRYGRDAARRVWQGGAVAIDLIGTNASDRSIAFSFLFNSIAGKQGAARALADNMAKAIAEELYKQP